MRHDDVLKCFTMCLRIHLCNFEFNSCLLEGCEQIVDLVHFGFLWIMFIFAASELRQVFVISPHNIKHLKVRNGCYKSILYYCQENIKSILLLLQDYTLSKIWSFYDSVSVLSQTQIIIGFFQIIKNIKL